MAKLRVIQVLVDMQAEDEALWAEPLAGLRSASEAYALQELRRLHEVIEADDNRAEDLIADYEPP